MVDSIKTDLILKALMNAKKEMGDIKKTSNNPFFKSKYSDLSTYIDAIEEALDKYGLIITQPMHISDGQQILSTILTHAESGQFILTECLLPNPKGDCQGLGASITYMRRYSIASLLCLCSEDDDGEKACIRPDTKKQQNTVSMPATQTAEQRIDMKIKSVITIDQLEKIVAMIQFCEKGVLENELLPNVRKILMDNKAELSDIPPELYDRIVTFLQNKIDKKNGNKS